MGEDPQVQCWTQPIYQWALLVQDKVITHDVLQKAWQRQVFRVLTDAKPWRQVAGTTGASYLRLVTLGGARFQLPLS
eukprot:3760628-Pyramimonas_sp.AAC.1